MNIHELNRHIKTALAKGGTIKVSLADSLLVITISKDKRATARLYQGKTLVKSRHHLATSVHELKMALIELVFIAIGGLCSLKRLFKTRKPLQIEYLPSDKDH